MIFDIKKASQENPRCAIRLFRDMLDGNRKDLGFNCVAGLVPNDWDGRSVITYVHANHMNYYMSLQKNENQPKT